MGRRQVRVVIAGRRVDIIAARRLQPDDHITAAKGGYGEAAAIQLSGDEQRIALGRSPTLVDFVLHRPRQAGEKDRVVGQRQGLADFPAGKSADVVGRPRRQALDQGVAVGRNILDPVAGLPHRPQHVDGAGRRVEADAVAEPAVAIGVVGEYQGDAAVGRRRPPQPGPVGGQPGDEGDAVGHRLVVDDVGFGQRVAAPQTLERDRAAYDPAVDLGKGDVHGDVAAGQPAGAAAPVGLVTAGEHGLQHRAIPGIERGCRLVSARGGDGKAGGVDNHVGRRLGEDVLQGCRRHRILEAGDEDRQRIQPRLGDALDQGVHRFQVAGLDQRPIEGQRRHRPVRLPVRPHRFEIAAIPSWPVEAGAQQRPRLPPFAFRAEQRRGEPEEVQGVVDAAVDAVLPQPVPGLPRNGRIARQLRIRLIVAGEEGNRNIPLPARRRHLLDTIGPVAAAAEQPNDDETGPGESVLDVEVHRHVVAEMKEAGEPQAGKAVLRQPRPRRRQAGELGIRGRKDDEVAGALSQVDGFAAVGDGAGSGGEQVHGSDAFHRTRAKHSGSTQATPSRRRRGRDPSGR